MLFIGVQNCHIVLQLLPAPPVEPEAEYERSGRRGTLRGTLKENHTILRLGISACLLGENVRYDGGHKLDRFIVHTLGQYVEWIPVCPETETGMPIPREALHLVGDPESPRLVTIHTKRDYTGQMRAWAQKRLNELSAMGLHGFVFKSKSPSCGLYRVPIHTEAGIPIGFGSGIFAREVMRRFPLLPLEEGRYLHDIPRCGNFIERVLAYRYSPSRQAENPR